MPRNYSKRSPSNARKLVKALLDALYEKEGLLQVAKKVKVEWATHNQVRISSSSGSKQRGTRIEYLAELVKEAGYTLNYGLRGKGTSDTSEIRDAIDYLKRQTDPFERDSGCGILREAKQESIGKGYRVFYLRLLNREASFEDNFKWFQLQQRVYSEKGTEQLSITATVLKEEKQHREHNIEKRDNYQDWGDAPELKNFVGRGSELSELRRWILKDRCRIVGILGFGGIGKTSVSLKLAKGGIGKTDLSLKLAHSIEEEFTHIVWRSVRGAPPLTYLLTEWLISLSTDDGVAYIPPTVDEKIKTLLAELQKKRCLLILDNVETILKARVGESQYRAGYENYGRLFNLISSSRHQSCLLMTSREKPHILDKSTPLIRTLQLSGLKLADCQKIFSDVGEFSGSDDEWQELVQFYEGNPLALELAARHILEVFFGSIHAFLRNGKQVFRDLNDLLDWHFNRLSSPEKEIAYWFAINQEPIPLPELLRDILSNSSRKAASLTLQSLQRRIPVERIKAKMAFTLQPVLMEYIIERIIKAAISEIRSGEVALLRAHAITKASSKDFIRNIQQRLILKEIYNELSESQETSRSLEDSLVYILDSLRTKPSQATGYAAGNILNLLCYANTCVQDYNFSHLEIRQAYLQNTRLWNIDFSFSSFSDTVFTETFGNVLALAFSPCGQLIATADTQGEICLWHLSDRQKKLFIDAHESWIWTIAFSKVEGKFIASGDSDGFIKIWCKKNGECLLSIKGHEKAVRSVDFSSEGGRLVSSSEDRTIKVWDIERGICLNTFLDHTDSVWSVAYDPSDSSIVSASGDSTIKIWDCDSDRCLLTLNGHSTGVKSVSFSCDGHMLLSGSDDGEVILWNSFTGEPIKIYRRHLGIVRSVAISPSGSMFASGGDDHIVKLWSIDADEQPCTLHGHSGPVRSVRFSPDSSTLATSSYDQTIKIWETETEHCLHTFYGHTNLVRFVTFNQDGSLIASANEDKTLCLWDTTTGNFRLSLLGHESVVWSASFSSDNVRLASGSSDKTIRIWEVSTGRTLNTLEGHKSLVLAVSFHHGGRILASGSEDSTVRIWDTYTGQCLCTLVDHNSNILSVTFLPESDMLASADGNGLIKFWNTSSGKCIRTIAAHSSAVRSVICSPTGDVVASAGDDCRIKVWNLKSGKLLHQFKEEFGAIKTLCFNFDGRLLCSGSVDGSVKVWEMASGHCVKTLPIWSSAIQSITYNCKDSTIAASSTEETIRVWSLYTGEYVRTLRTNRPYEGTSISGVSGLTEPQKTALKILGAHE
ncbi:MAG: hypothetical protein AAGF01_01640 [Cyanobacteria bacterium P01_G01_bin.38]